MRPTVFDLSFWRLENTISASTLSILVMVLVLLGSVYLLAPLKVRKISTRSKHAEYTPLAMADLPGDLVRAFQGASQQLLDIGFRSLELLQHKRHTQRLAQDGFVSLWVNERHGDSAHIIGARARNRSGMLRVTRLVTYRTEFSDGTSIRTSNSTSPSIWPADERVSSITCFKIYDLERLYRFHRARVERDGGGRTPTLEPLKEPASYMQREYMHTFERLVRAGYYTFEEASGSYVPTLKGCFLMTWKLLPPFRQIQHMRKWLQADHCLRELGFGGMRAFAQSDPDPSSP